MVAEVFGGISALKAAFDMTKALADMSDAAKRDRLSINLQKEILAAQAAQSELVEEISSLKAKLASFGNMECGEATLRTLQNCDWIDYLCADTRWRKKRTTALDLRKAATRIGN